MPSRRLWLSCLFLKSIYCHDCELEVDTASEATCRYLQIGNRILPTGTSSRSPHLGCAVVMTAGGLEKAILLGTREPGGQGSQPVGAEPCLYATCQAILAASLNHLPTSDGTALGWQQAPSGEEAICDTSMRIHGHEDAFSIGDTAHRLRAVVSLEYARHLFRYLIAVQ